MIVYNLSAGITGDEKRLSDFGCFFSHHSNLSHDSKDDEVWPENS